MLLLFLFALLLAKYASSCHMEDADLVMWAENQVDGLGGCAALSAGAEPVQYRIPKLKLFLYQRDDHETLADFLQYHSYVFGFENIIVFDQQSELEPVCRTLALFQNCGVKVITNSGSLAHKHKGATLTQVMKKYNDTFLIPLDSDEFIMPFAPDNTVDRHVTVDRDELLSAFKELPIDGRKYKFQFYSSGLPKTSTCVSSIADNETEFRRAVQNDHYFRMYGPIPMSKTFFHSNGFKFTDAGNHYGEVKHDKGKLLTHPDVVNNLSHYFAALRAQLVHFPIGGYRGAYEKYTRAAHHIGFTADTNCSVNINAGQYCEPCKIFVNGTDHGAQTYTELCDHTKHKLYHFTTVAEWFKKNTLSMTELTGLKELFRTRLRW